LFSYVRLRFSSRTCFGCVQVEAELKAGKDQSSFAKSTIVAASAPRELGSLRQADGAEGFENGTKA
jgi:GDP-D-mannose 3',5'-epimerase